MGKNVSNIKLVDEENEKIYFEANKGERLETHLFVVDFDGNDIEKLTNITGTHKINVSPNGKYFYDTFSNINTPGKLEIEK